MSCLYISKEDLDSRIPTYDLDKIRANCLTKSSYEAANLSYAEKLSEMMEGFAMKLMNWKSDEIIDEQNYEQTDKEK